MLAVPYARVANLKLAIDGERATLHQHLAVPYARVANLKQF